MQNIAKYLVSILMLAVAVWMIIKHNKVPNFWGIFTVGAITIIGIELLNSAIKDSSNTSNSQEKLITQ